MRLFLITILFIAVPFFSFSQGIKIKVGAVEYPTDTIPENVTFPEKVSKITIKKDKADSTAKKYIVQIGEEEHSFPPDGTYHVVEFSHDIRDMIIYVLNEKRVVQGKTFNLKKPK